MARIIGAALWAMRQAGLCLATTGVVQLAALGVARAAEADPSAPGVPPAAQGSRAATPAGPVESPPPEPGSLSYEFGRGLRLGSTGVTLGGYATLEARAPQVGPLRVESRHASLFLWWEASERLKTFAELDLQNLTEGPRERDDAQARRVSLERLYADYSVDDRLVLRAGKFLTPIGRWNLSHADPLVWTTTRPLVTQAVFPHNVTGVGAAGQVVPLGQPLSYSLYFSNGREWRPDPSQDTFSFVRGARLVTPLASELQLGLSMARYEQRRSRGDSRWLNGLDLLWVRQRWEVSAEWLHTVADNPALAPGPGLGPDHDEPGNNRRNETKAGYVQVVAPLTRTVYAIGRFDWMREPRAPQAVQQWLVGLAWRLNPAVTFKIEAIEPRRAGPGAEVRGLVGSASVLF